MVNPDEVAGTLCAVANNDGVKFIIGVKNKRTIIGVENTDRLLRVVSAFYPASFEIITIDQPILRKDEIPVQIDAIKIIMVP